MRIAVLADTHGNCLALDAVAADIRDAAPDLVVNLGDLVSGWFDPPGAADAQMALDALTIAGNHERQVLGGGPGPTDIFARAMMTEAHLAWLRSLPATLSLLDGEIFACHGSPAGGDLEYLLEDIATGRPVLAPEADIAPRLAGIGAARVVLCGHTHIQRLAQIGDVLVVNPGSVGLPAYADPEPTPHAMESGTPHARYAILTRSGGTWSVELRAVVYDWDKAAAQAIANGRPLAARWVMGRAN